MGQRTRTETDIHCDHCGRRVSKNRGRTQLTSDGPVPVARDGGTHCSIIDLCLPCDRSLLKWWARGDKGTDAAESVDPPDEDADLTTTAPGVP